MKNARQHRSEKAKNKRSYRRWFLPGVEIFKKRYNVEEYKWKSMIMIM